MTIVMQTNVTTEAELRRGVVQVLGQHGARGTFVPDEEAPEDGFRHLAVDCEVVRRPIESEDRYSARQLALIGALALLPGVVGGPLRRGERIVVLRWRPSL
jgi:hypothetical protein